MRLIIAFTCISIFTCACGSKSKHETSKTKLDVQEQIIKLNEQQIALAKIQLGSLEEKNISSTIKVNGKIDVPPQNMVSVSMPLGGYLKATKLLPGMHISKGEIIATMEDQQYIQLQQDYLTTKSKLRYTEAEYQRQKELNESKASSDKVFQQTQMEYSAQKIALNALGEKLKLININPTTLNETNISKSVHLYAPINGYVSKVDVNIGKYVNPSDILFELVNPTDIHLNLHIFEKDLDQLFIGQKLMAYSNNHPEEQHPCSIILISKDVNAERFAEVHCHFEQYDNHLLPGMYMNATIELKNSKTKALPESALVSFEGKQYVFIQKDKNTFEMQIVAVGARENGFIEIKNAAQLAQQKIVINGAYTLLMSLKNKSEEE
jgi:cobalt-zinc-cadmium efflux system membrane fusion protein